MFKDSAWHGYQWCTVGVRNNNLLLLYFCHAAPFPEFAAQTDRGEDASGRHDSTSHQVYILLVLSSRMSNIRLAVTDFHMSLMFKINVSCS